ncbi:MAG: DUF3795 domain-containing protein [Spirochaetales bacterium]|nr:MAG: DUF3795 domain-containing protein [Spirochaetales bacterium]
MTEKKGTRATSKVKSIHRPELIRPIHIAPCGMNCALCLAYLREKNTCPGCIGPDEGKSFSCVACRIKNCKQPKSRNSRFCLACAQFPCARLKHLDKRYRTKYGMSMIENLENIRELGIKKFVAQEKIRWKCPECGGTICVHRKDCIYCGCSRP